MSSSISLPVRVRTLDERLVRGMYLWLGTYLICIFGAACLDGWGCFRCLQDGFEFQKKEGARKESGSKEVAV